jgi:branched-chain amino acid transport system permease protein
MEYAASIFILIGLFVILASSFNLILGYSGLMSIAHPISSGLGAYTSSLTVMYFHVPVVVGILLGTIVAFVFSIALSLPSLRVSGDYLVIASMGFQLGLLQIMKSRLDRRAGSVTGITPLFDEIAMTSTLSYVILVFVAAAATVGRLPGLLRGDYGRAIAAMRDDEDAFKALGRNAVTMKIVLFGIGSACAISPAACTRTTFLFISPDQFICCIRRDFDHGGCRRPRHIMGPVVGAILLELSAGTELSASARRNHGSDTRIMFTGLVLIFLFLKPNGVLGEDLPNAGHPTTTTIWRRLKHLKQAADDDCSRDQRPA